MRKEYLRQQYKTRRQALTTSEQAALEAQLLQQFTGFTWPGIQTLMAYHAIAVQREINTLPFVQWLQQHNKALSVAYPVSDFETGSMEAVLQTTSHEVRVNKYGITEPAGHHIIPAAALQMILVPLLAFDQRGYRAGYGKGFYDRFFGRCHVQCLRVGLSLFEAEPIITGINEFDVPLTHCITPTSVYAF
jgi:5-formyltetrahydrofolate cyclo-ligase